MFSINLYLGIATIAFQNICKCYADYDRLDNEIMDIMIIALLEIFGTVRINGKSVPYSLQTCN